MRTALRTMNDARLVFRGTFQRFGVKHGWQGREDQTVLLSDITDNMGRVVADHVWFNLTKGFQGLKLQPGDVVQFNARVKSYEKGYKGWRDDVWDKPVETDYKLSHPTKLQIVSRAESVPTVESKQGAQ